jgi:hypothetical protein
LRRSLVDKRLTSQAESVDVFKISASYWAIEQPLVRIAVIHPSGVDLYPLADIPVLTVPRVTER